MTYCGDSEPSVGPVVAERVASRASRRAAAHQAVRSARAPGLVLGAHAPSISSAITSLASPTIGTSAARFLPISAGSMSAWTIVASGREASTAGR